MPASGRPWYLAYVSHALHNVSMRFELVYLVVYCSPLHKRGATLKAYSVMLAVCVG